MIAKNCKQENYFWFIKFVWKAFVEKLFIEFSVCSLKFDEWKRFETNLLKIYFHKNECQQMAFNFDML